MLLNNVEYIRAIITAAIITVLFFLFYITITTTAFITFGG